MEDGEIKPLSLQLLKAKRSFKQNSSAQCNNAMEVDEGGEMHYGGYPDNVPFHAGALVRIPPYGTSSGRKC